MEVALIGFSQSGKTSLFAAITEGRVHAAAAAARQIDKEVVKVPDPRVDALSKIFEPKKTTHATVDFLDMPGLSFADETGRHEARRIIADARQVDMLVIILAAFHDDAVAAYRDKVDPARDLEEIKQEFLLADLELVTNRIAKLEISVTKPTPRQEQDKAELILMRKCQEAIENVRPLSEIIQSPEQEKLLRSFGFLSLKPVQVVINSDEDSTDQPPSVSTEGMGGPPLVLCAKLEAELAGLDPEERSVFLEDMGITEIARDRLIHTCYQTLDLISFLTIGKDEVRAWTVPAGCPALEAAGQIHSDIQRGFIRAETVPYDDFIAAGDMKAAKAVGKVRLEGKTYPLKDGDIINFRFNV